MQNIYMIQASYEFGDNVHIPYTIGALAAYAWSKRKIRESFILKRLIYLREDVEQCVSSLERPAVAAFSCYIWNYEYNKALAKAIKKRYPECRIIFGGHQIPCNASTFDALDYVDILIFDEGEEAFEDVLRAIAEDGDLAGIPNIAFRYSGGYRMNDRAAVTNTDFPSPYMAGIFDGIMKNGGNFVAFLETNRGCPFQCSYCDWGAYKATLREFPMERIKADLDWMSDHKIEFVRCTDGNFGILKRDMEIADYIIEKKRTTGYPLKFRTAYTKNSHENVFIMNRKFNDNALCKGVTLSFQSLNSQALENVKRINMPLDKFKNLMTAYNEAGIPTYSELILGLPGETYTSFCNGVSSLIECGQHTSLAIYNLDLLVNSEMGQPEYIKKFGIKTVSTYADRYHGTQQSDDIAERSNIVVETYSMNVSDWVKANLFSSCILSCHCLGLLQYIAIYLHYEHQISYAAFYSGLSDFLLGSPGRMGSAAKLVKDRYEDFIRGEGAWGIVDARFGNLIWPYEEFMYLECVSQIDDSYGEISKFLDEYPIPRDLIAELIQFQKQMIRKPASSDLTREYSYDFYNYFRQRFLNKPATLHKVNNVITILDHSDMNSLEEYAVNVVWYGRKGGKNFYLNISQEIADDAG